MAAQVGAARSSRHPSSYSVTKIQDVKRGFKDLLVGDLTEKGVVVGGCYDEKVEHYRPFSFSSGKFTALGGSDDIANANAANDAGLVAGAIYQPYRDSAATFACVWKHGKRTNLGSISGTGAGEALGMNSAGDIVGTSESKDNGNTHATLWKHGKIVDLGTLGGNLSWAYAINGKGQIAGISTRSPEDDSAQHGFLWDAGKMTDLGTLGGDLSSGYKITEKGQVFGYSTIVAGSLSDQPRGRPFVWEKGEIKAIAPEGSRVEDISESGQRIGAQNGSAAIWIGDEPADLNTLVSGAEGVTFDLGTEVNGNGVIVVHADDGSYYLGTPKK